ncbi:hypothetical protein [Microtetraspora niveoalba]|uniref:hypothetical protein n=1 Tax=Microtetraspora niveoalba TaxID=46175 RepID=UPI00082D5B28|nr:hypothetical protein [Microtetraspora niveoalba]
MRPTRHDLTPCPNGCGERILWTRTEHGERLAVDAQPSADGNQAVMKNGLGRWISRSLDGAGALPPSPYEHTFKPHFRKSGCAKLRPAQPELPGLLPTNVVRIGARRASARRRTRR